MVRFSWLHLTDLHWGMEGQPDYWPQAEDKFYHDLAHVIEYVKPLDLVLFTGDLTQRGTCEQFQSLDKLLIKVWARLRTNGSEPKLVAVPGNHDLVRPNEGPTVRSLVKLWDDPNVLKAFWNNPKSRYRKLVVKAFANYSKWWESTPILKPDKYLKGILPGAFATTIEKQGVKLGIVGLNSSFLHLMPGFFEKKLALHVRQFHKACAEDGITWTKERTVCLLMTHHPPSWLTREAKAILDGEIHEPPHRFALHLFGHMHEPELRSVALGGSDPRRTLQGCSLFSMEEWEDKKGKKQKRHYGYSVGELKIEGGGGAALRIWPRKATNNPNGGWDFDRDTEKFSLPKGEDATEWMPIKLLSCVSPNIGATEKPHVSWTFSPTPERALRPAYQILPITDTAYFSGRKTQLNQLCDRLLRAEETPEHPLLAGIWGPPGAGKSALATVFAERKAEYFLDGILTVDCRANRTAEAIAYHFAALIGEPVNPEYEGRLKAGEIMQSRFARRRCLLILDNADEGTFRDMYPHGRSALVVTSKSRPVLLRMGLRDSDLTHTDRLAPDEARDVLTKILGEQGVAAESSTVEQLLDLLGHLAMAIRIAGGAIAEQIGPQPIARYLKLLQGRSADLSLALQLEGDEQLHLARVFELSLDLLKPEHKPGRAEDDDCRVSYVRLSACDPGGFSHHAAEAVMELPADKAEERLTRFANLALLEYKRGTDRFRFHPLLQSFARRKANERGVYGQAALAHRDFFSAYVRARAEHTAENLVALVAEQDAIVMVAREGV